MRRRPLTALVTVLALGLGAAGCGVPERTGVEVDGRGPSPDSSTERPASDDPPVRENSRTEGSNFVRDFVRDFLSAAAGDSGGAVQRVNAYLAPNVPGLSQKPGVEVPVNVVRLADDGITVRDVSDRTQSTASGQRQRLRYEVTVRVQQVGVLRPDGSLTPPVATADSYHFTVGTHPYDARATGLFVLESPNALLLSTDALDRYFEDVVIYFWNTDQTALVPDVRHLPGTVPTASRATEVLGRLLTAGPSDWLRSTATDLPGGAKVVGNIPQRGGDLEVNLSGIAGDDEDRTFDLLATQIAWSVPKVSGQQPAGQLEIKVQNQTRRKVNLGKQRSDHAIYQLGDRNVHTFCVVDGVIRPLAILGTSGEGSAEPGGAGDRTPPIAEALNHDVVTAAMARYGGDQVMAALVVRNGELRQLAVGKGRETVTKVERSAAYRRISRPVWLRSDDSEKAVGLVVADDRLYRFSSPKPALVEVRIPDIAPGAVTAISMARDGHRLAFVANGQLYVAAVTVGPDKGVTVGPPRRVVTSVSDIRMVEWLTERSLAVAGTRGGGVIYEVSVDGVTEAALVAQSELAAPVTALAAHPGVDEVWPEDGLLLYESSDGEVRFNFSEDPIRDDRVVGVQGDGDLAVAGTFFLY